MSTWLKSNLVAVLREDSSEKALRLATTVLENDIQVLEVTYTTPGADQVIEELVKAFPNASIGAGSITNLEQAHSAHKSGAKFFVSPHFNKSLSKWFIENQLEYIPGGMTPTELQNIFANGHAYQKLFPAMILGASGLKNLLAPLPHLQLIATGGINLNNAKAYLDAGAHAICVGGALFNSNDLANDAKKWAAL